MELGEKLRMARREAGVSQRELCGDRITRNMLSQIENGSASPSVATLRFLAQRLGKPVSFFLEEEGEVSRNLEVMEKAREAYDRGAYEEAFRWLRDFREPDPVLAREWELLRLLTLLALAEQALGQGREPYARELLAQAREAQSRMAYDLPELRRRSVLLKARLRDEKPGELVRELPGLDEELRLRALAALEAGEPERCARLLDAAENRQEPYWLLLRGKVWLEQGAYREAAGCFHAAENACPRETAPLLERCYRELGDYQLAYRYACMDRELAGQIVKKR